MYRGSYSTECCVCQSVLYFGEIQHKKKGLTRNDKIHCESVFCYFASGREGFARAADLISEDWAIWQEQLKGLLFLGG